MEGQKRGGRENSKKKVMRNRSVRGGEERGTLRSPERERENHRFLGGVRRSPAPLFAGDGRIQIRILFTDILRREERERGERKIVKLMNRTREREGEGERGKDLP